MALYYRIEISVDISRLFLMRWNLREQCAEDELKDIASPMVLAISHFHGKETKLIPIISCCHSNI